MTPTTKGSGSRWSARSQGLVVGMALAAAGVVTAAVVTKGSSNAKATIPAGTHLIGALNHTITTEHGRVGETFELRTVNPLQVGNGTLPAGMTVHGEVTATEGGGRIAGAPSLTLRFTRLDVDGHEYPLTADPFRVRGHNDAKESIAEIGGGAVVGGVVGAIAGSTLKGAVVGAVLGTGVAVATKGNQIVLPAGQKLSIRIAEPVTVSYRRAAAKS
jgi:hypothetical protein